MADGQLDEGLAEAELDELDEYEMAAIKAAVISTRMSVFDESLRDNYVNSSIRQYYIDHNNPQPTVAVLLDMVKLCFNAGVAASGDVPALRKVIIDYPMFFNNV